MLIPDTPSLPSHSIEGLISILGLSSITHVLFVVLWWCACVPVLHGGGGGGGGGGHQLAEAAADASARSNRTALFFLSPSHSGPGSPLHSAQPLDCGKLGPGCFGNYGYSLSGQSYCYSFRLKSFGQQSKNENQVWEHSSVDSCVSSYPSLMSHLGLSGLLYRQFHKDRHRLLIGV